MGDDEERLAELCAPLAATAAVALLACLVRSNGAPVRGPGRGGFADTVPRPRGNLGRPVEGSSFLDERRATANVCASFSIGFLDERRATADCLCLVQFTAKRDHSSH